MATIYKLICDDPELVYYGSTTMPLWKRYSKHKCERICLSRKLFDVGGVKIIELEKASNEERFKREQYYLDNFPSVNSQRAYTTEEQKKEQSYQRGKRWYEKNKERLLQDWKEKITCECGVSVGKNDFNRHKRCKQHQVYEFLKQIEESNVAMPE